MAEHSPTPDTEERSKYSAEELDELGAKGQAFKNDKGDWSYPIKTEDDAKKAIRAVGRGGADHDAIRKYIIKVVKKLGWSELVPDSWAADGSIKESESAWTPEQRDTAHDVFVTLEGALHDAFEEQYDRWCIWVQDWAGGGKDDNPYQVIYQLGGDLWSCGFSYDDDQKIQLDIEGAVKVRPLTQYVERGSAKARTGASMAREQRKEKVELMKKLPEYRDWQTSFGSPEIELREQDDGTIVLSGYGSVTETPYPIGFYDETVVRSAFKRTLAEGCDTQFLVNHSGGPLARTTTGSLDLDENQRGLWYAARLQPWDPDVASIRPKLERGDLSESSFAFLVREQEWDADFTKRALLDVSLHRGDVSVVNYGANPATTASLRSLQAVGLDRFAGSLQELRAGKKLSAGSLEVLTQVLDLVAEADEAVDRAQPLLADLMGVDNPDDPEEQSEEQEGERSQPMTSFALARAIREREMAR
jgi:Escherichia/Staphylococcus phage prohead protease